MRGASFGLLALFEEIRGDARRLGQRALAPIGQALAKGRFIEHGELLGARRELLVDAKLFQFWRDRFLSGTDLRCRARRMARRGGEHLAQAPLGADAQLGSVHLEIAVLCPPGVFLERGCSIRDVLDLSQILGFRKRPGGGVIARHRLRGSAGRVPGPANRPGPVEQLAHLVARKAGISCHRALAHTVLDQLPGQGDLLVGGACHQISPFSAASLCGSVTSTTGSMTIWPLRSVVCELLPVSWTSIRDFGSQTALASSPLAEMRT